MIWWIESNERKGGGGKKTQYFGRWNHNRRKKTEGITTKKKRSWVKRRKGASKTPLQHIRFLETKLAETEQLVHSSSQQFDDGQKRSLPTHHMKFKQQQQKEREYTMNRYVSPPKSQPKPHNNNKKATTATVMAAFFFFWSQSYALIRPASIFTRSNFILRMSRQTIYGPQTNKKES